MLHALLPTVLHALLPTVLHVLGLVHADGQLDAEVPVRTAFGHCHLVELGLLGAVGGRVEHHLRGGGKSQENRLFKGRPPTKNQRTHLHISWFIRFFVLLVR